MFIIYGLAGHAKNIVEYMVLRVFRIFATKLPLGFLIALGEIIAYVCSSVLQYRRSEVEDHLTLAFPDQDSDWRKKISLDSYKHFGRECLSFLRTPNPCLQEDIEITGFEALVESLEKGSGVMMVSGHLGNWEVGATALAARGIPIDVVALRQRNPFVDKYLVDLRKIAGVGVIRNGDGAYAILESLRNGKVIGCLGDQNPVGSSVTVDFMGVPSRTAKDSVTLTLRSGAELFFASCVLPSCGRRKYRLELEKISIPSKQNRVEMIEKLTKDHTQLLETAIRRNPDQYLWHHRRWKDRG